LRRRRSSAVVGAVTTTHSFDIGQSGSLAGNKKSLFNRNG
jgi:hypothetical protein